MGMGFKMSTPNIFYHIKTIGKYKRATTTEHYTGTGVVKIQYDISYGNSYYIGRFICGSKKVARDRVASIARRVKNDEKLKLTSKASLRGV